ncbi:hypothetical protein HDF08_003635 [Edaphobacter lichenicola]|uniref:Uncharacterized protein n=1 Tax=Tunturiibacter lichenicola TaxID=2051959 RepID=A0A852VFD5_9BACT|nr:hypothetical protein [Edaphobacter lichenicola]
MTQDATNNSETLRQIAIKATATVKQYFYDTHNQLKAQLTDL